MDYKNSLNLPKTDFPMKANLTAMEPRVLERWYADDLYGKIQHRNQKNPLKFLLHDGPPYANGHVHLGTALNKILKDFIVKSRTMMGAAAPAPTAAAKSGETTPGTGSTTEQPRLRQFFPETLYFNPQINYS